VAVVAEFNHRLREKDELTRRLVVLRHHILTLSKLTQANEGHQRFLMKRLPK
jgi:hypothetical protein